MGRHEIERELTDEKDLSTIKKKTGQQARVSQENDDSRGTCCTEQTKKQGTKAIDCYGLTLSERLRKEQRLRSSERIREICRNGQRVHGRSFVLYWMPNEVMFPRLAILVGRRCGKAHMRNRWKRQVREAFRRSSCMVGLKRDVVVRIKQKKTSLEGPSLYWELKRMFQEEFNRK